VNPEASYTPTSTYRGLVVVRVVDALGQVGTASAPFSATIDGDLIPDPIDLCPTEADVSNIDTDHDGIGDSCDPTPFPNQDLPGVAVSSSAIQFATASAVTVGGSARITIQSSTPADTPGNFTVKVFGPDGLVTGTYTVPATVTATTTTTTFDLPGGWQRGPGVYRFEIVFTQADGRTEVPDNDPLLTLTSCSICVAGSAQNTVSISGSAAAVATTGDIAVLSNAIGAVRVTGTGLLKSVAGAVRIRGTATTTGQGRIEPAPTAANVPLTLPRQPTVPTLPEGTTNCTITATAASCTAPGPQPLRTGNTWTLPDGNYADITVTGTTVLTMGPGRYRRLTVAGASTVTLRPGIYVLTSADLTGTSTLTGSAATIFFSCGATCPTAALTASGQTIVTLGSQPSPSTGLVVDDRNPRTIALSGTSKLVVNTNIDAASTGLSLTGASVVNTKRMTVATLDLTGTANLTVTG
jgi:hypothetical protein